MLNFDEKGFAIAVEKNHKKSRIVYLDKDSNQVNISDDFLETTYGRKARTQRMKSILRNDIEDKIEEFTNNEIHVSGDAHFEVLPPSITDRIERDVFFISGKSGSGKSYFSAELLEKYRRSGIKKIFIITDIKDSKFGKAKYLDINNIVVNSQDDFEERQKEYEKKMIKFKYMKNEMDDIRDIMNLELELKEMKPKRKGGKAGLSIIFDEDDIQEIFSDSVVLFDDYEKNKDKDKIELLRDHLLTKGRHYRCSLIICNHKAQGGQSFSLIKEEATDYVVFSKSLARTRHILFQDYLGFNTSQIKRVTRMLKKSRWVSFNTDDKYLISQKEILTVE